jgi:acetylglutamate kinase
VSGDDRPLVVKLGGAAVAGVVEACQLAAGRPLVVVHGGGAQISELMRRRDIEPRFVGGRRVTDLPTLACARHALARVSDALVAALAVAGTEAVPLRLGEALLAERIVELGLVGRVVEVRPELFAAAFARAAVPVLAPLARDASGRFLNVNADDVAAAVASAIAADELVFLSDVPGVLDAEGAVIPEIRAADPPAVSGGMVPKLAACAEALRGGVGRVRIGAGTVVTP